MIMKSPPPIQLVPSMATNSSQVKEGKKFMFVRRIVCMLHEWKHENLNGKVKELINSILSSLQSYLIQNVELSQIL